MDVVTPNNNIAQAPVGISPAPAQQFTQAPPAPQATTPVGLWIAIISVGFLLIVALMVSVADTTYPYALEDAQKICSQAGYFGGTVSWGLFTWLGGTDVSDMKAVFAGKSKAQIAAIQQAFSKTSCNQTLDAFLQTYVDKASREQIYQIIKSAQ